jgi:predicted  nucleic acid-binding Zn-ribbon protein
VSGAADRHPLLHLQAVDSSADALAVDRVTLPQRAALIECEAERVRIAEAARAAEERGADLGAAERKLAGEVAEAVRSGREAEDTLYSGSVTSVAELEGLQAKLNSIRAQQAELEERQLGLMESHEEIDAEIASLASQAGACAARQAELARTLAADEEAIDARLLEVAKERDGAAERVSAAVRETYERLRKSTRLGGVVVAQLNGNACGRCRIPAPVMHVTRVRQSLTDDVVRCENCSRILLA